MNSEEEKETILSALGNHPEGDGMREAVISSRGRGLSGFSLMSFLSPLLPQNGDQKALCAERAEPHPTEVEPGYCPWS